MKHNHFILPHGDHSVICTLKNKEIIEVAPVSLPANCYFSMTEKWIACITQKGRKISLIKIGENNKFESCTAILLPKKYHADAIAIVNDTLFVGGRCGKEVLGRYDLSSESPTWTSLEVPEQLQRYNKSIDDLLIDGDRLIAVDNFVIPKWLLLYDISKPGAPQLCSYPKLESHGTNERIHMGTLGLNWLALQSFSTGMRGNFSYISLLKKNELLEILTLSCEQLRTYNNHPKRVKSHYVQWGKICFLEDTLLITSFKDGVGVLDLIAPPSAEKLFYCFPEFIPGDSVIDIISVPLAKEVIVISTAAKETFFTVVSKNDFL